VHSLAAGVLAAVLFLSTPWTVALATAGYNEGPVAMYAILAIFALWLGAHEQNRPHAMRLMALAGFLAGSAVACKYPPLLFLVVPLASWLLLPWRAIGHRLLPAAGSQETGGSGRDLTTAARAARVAMFLAAVAAACDLWFAKNGVQTNNPTYPLLYSVFDGSTRTPEKDAQWRRVHSPQPDAEGRRFTLRQFTEQIAWNLWRTLWASLAIPPLAALAWLARGERRLLAVLALWIGFVFVMWWLLTHRLDRFLVLVLPAAALMASIGALAVPHRAWRTTALAFIAAAAIVQFPFVTLHPDNRYFAPLDRLRYDDRGLGLQGLRVEAGHRWLNEHAAPGERVLLLGDAEPFDLEMPATYNTCFDDCQFTRIFRGRTRAERLALLEGEKIAYVFCSWSHLARYRSPGNYGYTSDYPTRALVHRELVGEQQLLVPIPIETEPELAELFAVARK
jgi:hypothetical protein